MQVLRRTTGRRGRTSTATPPSAPPPPRLLDLPHEHTLGSGVLYCTVSPTSRPGGGDAGGKERRYIVFVNDREAETSGGLFKNSPGARHSRVGSSLNAASNRPVLLRVANLPAGRRLVAHPHRSPGRPQTMVMISFNMMNVAAGDAKRRCCREDSVSQRRLSQPRSTSSFSSVSPATGK